MKIRNFDAPENINDEFSDITGLLKFYQNDIDLENSLDQFYKVKKSNLTIACNLKITI